MDRMSGQDATMFLLEDGRNPMHIGNVLVFEGPSPTYREYASAIRARLDRVPRYRQRVAQLPLQLGRPVWVDDDEFDIHDHVRRAELAPPAGERALQDLAGELFGRRISLEHSPWEMWFVRGLPEGRWAVICKTHHAMVDGVAGTDILTRLLDGEPHPRRPAPAAWRPEAAPGTLPILLRTAEESAAAPVAHLDEVAAAAAHPLASLERAAAISAGVASWAASLFQPAAPGLNGRLRGPRRWGWTGTTLEALRPIRAAFGVTVNDIVLAAETRGFRELLLSRGDRVERRVVRSLVPVSVRSEGELHTSNNRVSGYFVDLPVGEPDPVERLRLVQAEMGQLKRSSQAAAADVLVHLTGWLPAPVLALGCRAVTEWRQPYVNTVTTNVPGPQRTLYACGRRLVAAYPYVPLWGVIRASVAVFSYCGRLEFGVGGDSEGVPDLEVLIDGIAAGLRELAALAESRRGRHPGGRRPRVAAVGG